MKGLTANSNASQNCQKKIRKMQFFHFSQKKWHISFLTLIKNYYLFLYNFMLLFFKYEKYLQSLVPKALTSIVLLLFHC